MKKTEIKDLYTAGMSLDTGCLVLMRNNKVMGSMNREQSMAFANDILIWVPPEMRPQAPKLTIINGDVSGHP